MDFNKASLIVVSRLLHKGFSDLSRLFDPKDGTKQGEFDDLPVLAEFGDLVDW